ncbi:MAG: peptidase M64 [Acidobacteria bacterium]|nr:MAG: peptidase M64 [Acidobacteriota bacterium]
MKRILLFLLLLATTLFAADQQTMRVDYYHTGNATQEMFSLDRIVIEPLPWPGNPNHPIDDTNLGKYFFEVRDRASNQVVYSRGFSSVFGEWELLDEAKTSNKTISESFRFPAPAAPVQVVLKKRDKNNDFQQIWSFVIDPKDIFIDTSKPTPPGSLIEVQKMGDPAHKVDLLILGDGYTLQERDKFEKDARHLSEILFKVTPFKEHKNDFNVWALCPPAAESGISRPSQHIYHRNPLGTTYDTFASERYVLTVDNRAFRDVASYAPYEFVEILVNHRTYGGGGIFNLYATAAAGSSWIEYLFVHEFGHHFAGLSDEYFSSGVEGQNIERIEPWEPNVTVLLDPAHLKWKDLVDPGTPIPTPWAKEAFEKHQAEYQKKRAEIRAQNKPEEVMEQLFLEAKQFETKLLSSDQYSGKVGAFEGANYSPKGFYRPSEDCIMFARDEVPFCRVCQSAIERVIKLYTQ